MAHRTAAHEMFDRDKASQGLGMELVQAADGDAVVRMRVTGEMVNGHGMVHGGYVFIVADTAFACACNSHGPVALSAGADITYLQPTRPGAVLEARARECSTSGRSGVYDVTVLADGDVVAEFRGRSRVVSRGAPA
jgi:acyl-CoA thioesterase